MTLVVTYWDEIGAALTSLPESSPYRSRALASLDHLEERVLANYAESARLIASLNGQVYDWRRIAEALGYVEGDA